MAILRFLHNLVTAGTLTTLLAACSNHYDGSTRVANPPAIVTKAFVIVKTGKQTHSAFADQIVQGVLKDFQNCGVQAMGDSAPAENGTLNLTDAPGQSLDDKIRNFAPDYVLYIQDPINIISFENNTNKYEAFIHIPGAPVGQNIWHAQFIFAPMFGLNDGTSLADSFFKMMLKDGVLPSTCTLHDR